jgi:hypothetical protein
MKGKTAVRTALLFALSLSPMWVLAESDVTTPPLKEACADSETSVWCADTSDSGPTEVRHLLAPAFDQRGEPDYSYDIELGGCDSCFEN